MDEQSTSPVVGLIRDLYHIFNAAGPSPKAGSPAEIEIRSFPDPEASKTAFAQGVVALESAKDYLEALDLLVHTKNHAVAPWACARGVLEASSLTTWLLETQINAKERVGRSLSLRFATLQEQEKLARSKHEGAKVQEIKDRIEAIERDALQLGFQRLRDKKNKQKRIGIGKIKPSITNLVHSQFDRENLYRILSGVAHSDYTTLLQLSFMKPNEDQSGVLTTQRGIPEGLQLMLLANAAAVYSRGAWLRTIQFGGDAAKVAVMLESRYNELSLADTNEVRFWRMMIDASIPVKRV